MNDADRLAKIEDKLQEIQIQLAEYVRPLHDRVERHDYLLNGNGTAGLRTDVDRLKQDAKRAGTFIWWAFTSIAALFADLFHRWFTTKSN